MTAGPVEVRIWRGGGVAHREVCADGAEAAQLVERWAEFGITGIDVDDLTVHHLPGQVLESDLEPESPEIDLDADEAYRRS
jgi:hypothetical protein